MPERPQRWLPPRLRARVGLGWGWGWVPAGPGTRAGATVHGGALERGDGAAREPLAQLGDTLSGVAAAA